MEIELMCVSLERNLISTQRKDKPCSVSLQCAEAQRIIVFGVAHLFSKLCNISSGGQFCSNYLERVVIPDTTLQYEKGCMSKVSVIIKAGFCNPGKASKSMQHFENTDTSNPLTSAHSLNLCPHNTWTCTDWQLLAADISVTRSLTSEYCLCISAIWPRLMCTESTGWVSISSHVPNPNPLSDRQVTSFTPTEMIGLVYYKPARAQDTCFFLFYQMILFIDGYQDLTDFNK